MPNDDYVSPRTLKAFIDGGEKMHSSFAAATRSLADVMAGLENICLMRPTNDMRQIRDEAASAIARAMK